ncbi:MAG: hypothetical protein ACK46Q_01525 [Hyphomonas sp.]
MTTPEHRHWSQAEIRKTLAAKAAGRITYRSLEEIVRKFTPKLVRIR